MVLLHSFEKNKRRYLDSMPASIFNILYYGVWFKNLRKIQPHTGIKLE